MNISVQAKLVVKQGNSTYTIYYEAHHLITNSMEQSTS